MIISPLLFPKASETFLDKHSDKCLCYCNWVTRLWRLPLTNCIFLPMTSCNVSVSKDFTFSFNEVKMEYLFNAFLRSRKLRGNSPSLQFHWNPEHSRLDCPLCETKRPVWLVPVNTVDPSILYRAPRIKQMEKMYTYTFNASGFE